jgi:L-aspartate oxidase
MLRTPLPVVPAAHYQCGGVLTDVDGRTSLAGLFAAGETACTGVHGANRLASNSLLEALVFAHRAAAAVRTGSAAPPVAASSPAPESEPPPAEGARVDSLRKDLQAMMWEKAGIVRSDAQLADAAATIARMAADLGGPTATACAEALELRNLLDVARLIVRGAMLRRESRGLHFNTDHPYRDNERFLCDTRITL